MKEETANIEVKDFFVFTEIKRVKNYNSRENQRIQTKVKLERAQGECLGIGSRRRTWQAAKSCGQSQADVMNRRCPNGAIHTVEDCVSHTESNRYGRGTA